jgi:hypothetical protein
LSKFETQTGLALVGRVIDFAFKEKAFSLIEKSINQRNTRPLFGIQTKGIL